MLTKEIIDLFINILKDELILATGCTEPSAIAMCAAKMRDVLGRIPTEVQVAVSGNIVKNAKSVIVPGTGGLKGIQNAVAAGIIAGKAEEGLQVISGIKETQRNEIAHYAQNTPIRIMCVNTPHILDVSVTGYIEGESALVQITDSHINIVKIIKNGEILLDEATPDLSETSLYDESMLNIKNIVEFSESVDLSLVKDMLDRQIKYNSAIAKEGLCGDWGASIGKTLLNTSNDIRVEASAYAAAGSDARMGGCDLPVVILTGSGNQGLTASLPVIRYANKLNRSKEELYRALLVSNLITIYQKMGIGRLSAYCGAISAGVGAGAGITWLHGGRLEEIEKTVINAVAILSGTICDGAKASCAAKIAVAVNAGILGSELSRIDKNFHCGEGIVAKNADSTFANVGILAREGMGQTDKTILQIMLNA